MEKSDSFRVGFFTLAHRDYREERMMNCNFSIDNVPIVWYNGFAKLTEYTK